ncbi:MAG: hypothetical protein GTO53_00515 [Planctomycetales bacterium]|nr:hypothetical protein [Planctomycetales bacterium]NIM07663.1 hypothetical protein [Planctomycetales bacterium]NIN07168.1 hypothetical protein [Planctomycetales bacterium]NIN76261.1 hypothetical protein [Planctomycetales bacterium]NIO33477.1 hypothetical protein [Planctomycetales bacterium]
MWCKHCRQDVPAIAVAENTLTADGSTDRSEGAAVSQPQAVTGKGKGTPHSAPSSTAPATAHFVCARCGEVIATAPPIRPADEGVEGSEPLMATGASASSTCSAFQTWEWELDQELHDVQHLLQSRAGNSEVPAERRATLYDEIHQALEVAPAAIDPAVILPTTAEVSGTDGEKSAPFLPWLVVAIGLMVLTCGGVLLGWSAVTGRGELWQAGLPIALAGQAVLLIGLVPLLQVLGRERHAAHQKPAVAKPQPGTARRTLQVAEQQPAGGGGQHDYAVDPAHTVPPQRVLANIKRQLDLLSDQIGRDTL